MKKTSLNLGLLSLLLVPFISYADVFGDIQSGPFVGLAVSFDAD